MICLYSLAHNIGGGAHATGSVMRRETPFLGKSRVRHRVSAYADVINMIVVIRMFVIHFFVYDIMYNYTGLA